MEIVTLGGKTAPATADHGFDAEAFRQFISFDVGDGDAIFWHSVGKLYRQPGGEIIAGVEALVSNRLVRIGEDDAEALCRTIVITAIPRPAGSCRRPTGATSSASTPTSSPASSTKAGAW